MKFKAVVGSGGLLARPKEVEFDNYEEAAKHSDQITIELSTDEYANIEKYVDQLEKKTDEYHQQLNKAQEEIKAYKQHYENLAAKFNNAQEQITGLQTQLASLDQVKGELEQVKAELRYWKPQNKILKKANINPFAYGVSLKKGKTSPKEAVKHSHRSLQLLEHLDHCPVLVRLAAERLLGCGRKAAKAALIKLYRAGYLEYVTFVGAAGESEIELYYAPDKIQGPVTANQACQAAILSLLYSCLFTGQSSFQRLKFEVVNQGLYSKSLTSKPKKLSTTDWYFAAYVNYTFVRRLKDGQIQENKRSLFAVPVRHQEENYGSNDIKSNYQMFYIYPLTVEEAKEKADEESAYLTDETLLKNSISVSYK